MVDLPRRAEPPAGCDDVKCTAVGRPVDEWVAHAWAERGAAGRVAAGQREDGRRAVRAGWPVLAGPRAVQRGELKPVPAVRHMQVLRLRREVHEEHDRSIWSCRCGPKAEEQRWQQRRWRRASCL